MKGYNRAGQLKRISNHDRRRTRREQAIARQVAYNALSKDEKIARLIPGGSSRQRRRLSKCTLAQE